VAPSISDERLASMASALVVATKMTSENQAACLIFGFLPDDSNPRRPPTF
jgi:hypothetical protein